MANKTANVSTSLSKYQLDRGHLEKLDSVLKKKKNNAVGGANILDLARELRDEIYEMELNEIRIIRAYSLQLPFQTAYFAVGDPFRFLKIHPSIRAEWIQLLPILQNIEVRIDSVEQDNYKRAHPYVKCEDIVSPLEKVFTPWLVIYFTHALHEDATNPTQRYSPRVSKKTNEVQLSRLVQMKQVFEYAHKLLRGLNKITFCGDAGCYEFYNPPGPVFVPLSKDINEIDPQKYNANLKPDGNMVPFWEHREWKEIVTLLRTWSGERIKEVSFEPGFFSDNEYEEEWIVYGIMKQFNRADLKATVERYGEPGSNNLSGSSTASFDDNFGDIFTSMDQLTTTI